MNGKLTNYKTPYKAGLFKRLRSRSRILTYLDSLSARVNSFFKDNKVSKVTSDCYHTDRMLQDGMLIKVLRIKDIDKNIIKPSKLWVANRIQNSYLTGLYGKLVAFLLSAGLRFYGIISLIFGVFGVLSYVAKKFELLAFIPSEQDLFWAVFLIIAGVPMLFSGKSISENLTKSKFFNLLFVDLLGINPMAMTKHHKGKTNTTTAFVTGTVLGVASVFISPGTLVLSFFAFIAFMIVLYMPETGLLGSILVFPFVSLRVLALFLSVTILSYVLKILYSKRNISFKTADIFLLFFTLITFFAGIITPGGGNTKALYLLCFISVYFLITNLVTTSVLLRKLVYSFMVGSGIGFVLYIIEVLSGWEAFSFANPLTLLTDNRVGGLFGFGIFAAVILPISISLYKSAATKVQKRRFALLAFLSIASLGLTKEPLVLITAYVGLFVYLLFAYDKPVKTFAMFLALTAFLYVTIPITPYLSELFSQGRAIVSGDEGSKVLSQYFFTGLGIGRENFDIAANKLGLWANFSNLCLYQSLISEGGLAYLVTFGLGVFFVLRRGFYCLLTCNSKKITGVLSALIAGIFLFLLLGIYYNVWIDLKLYLLFWMLNGIVSATKNVYGRMAYIKEVMATYET